MYTHTQTRVHANGDERVSAYVPVHAYAYVQVVHRLLVDIYIRMHMHIQVVHRLLVDGGKSKGTEDSEDSHA